MTMNFRYYVSSFFTLCLRYRSQGVFLGGLHCAANFNTYVSRVSIVSIVSTPSSCNHAIQRLDSANMAPCRKAVSGVPILPKN